MRFIVMRETQRGTVSSNSRFQAVLFQQYSANLSSMIITPNLYVVHYEYIAGRSNPPGRFEISNGMLT